MNKIGGHENKVTMTKFMIPGCRSRQPESRDVVYLLSDTCQQSLPVICRGMEVTVSILAEFGQH